jgi:hypothetical protein
MAAILDSIDLWNISKMDTYIPDDPLAFDKF